MTFSPRNCKMHVHITSIIVTWKISIEENTTEGVQYFSAVIARHPN